MELERGGWQVARVLALGAAGGATASLVVVSYGLVGPWRLVALVLALLALTGFIAVVMAMQRREAALRRIARRAQHDQAEVESLQKEIDRHHLLEQELLGAKQAAESAMLAKGEFLATMSHEIRTPLNGIVPMLDLLQGTRLQPDQHELLRTAYASSQQLLRIVDDILDYSKLEANKLELESTPFNLRELLGGVLQLMERPAESKGLRLHLHVDPSVRLPVRGDPVRLRQVLTNLIGNAVKFTERGSVSLDVRRTGETAAHHVLRFEVRDTGIGISQAQQARLFQAFSQADASTTRLYGGTGLGLAICKRIVDLMGGTIGVQSEPGQGATFHFQVPLAKVHGDLRAVASDSSGGRVLLLTADERLRSRLSMLLPNWGLRVTSVETTQEALDRLRAAATQGPPWTYSVVLADLAGIRTTALALHRNLGRHGGVFGKVRQVYLSGDDEIPEELRRNTDLLPRHATDAELRAALAAPSSASDAGGAALPGVRASDPPPLRRLHGRVLLVEDNPVNLLVAQRLLGVVGLECDTATNGEIAVMKMGANRYDLVLMDCQMPVLDGYSATRRWREREQAEGGTEHLPIVAMTANAMAGDRQKCLDAGMDDYLAKPVTRGQLESCLHRWLSATGTARTHASGTGTSPAEGEGADAPAGTAPPDARESAPADDRAPAPANHPDVFDEDFEQLPDAPPAVLDEEVLGELATVLGAETGRVIAVFLEDAPSLVEKLEQAALEPDFEGLRESAHALKSSAANLGAMALSQAAKRVELGARTGTLDRPAVAVALVAGEFDRARAALRSRQASFGTFRRAEA
ncbi:ATP-binding protein [Luteimonas pelagia]